MNKQIKQYLSNQQQYLNNSSIEQIIQLINYTSKKYYENQPVIDDDQFDYIIDYVKQNYPNNDILKQIGYQIEKNKIQLPFFMGSMDKIKQPDQKSLDKFIKQYPNNDYIYSDKLDGISGLLYKVDDKLYLYKRGDGFYGTDISQIIQYINFGINYKQLQQNLDNKQAIRGELIMSIQNFNQFKDKFKNARNLVNGIINQKKISQDLKYIDFVAYELVNPWMQYQVEQFKFFNKLKINVVFNEQFKQINFSTLSQLLLKRKLQSKYKIDGIIISSNHIQQRSLDKNPSYAFAYKENELYAIVKVLDIEWNISKDGYIKPTIILEPTNIGDVEISRTTGFNAKYIYDNNIGKGTIVKLIRSGDVIPHIVEIIKQSKQPLMPQIDYIWNDTKVDIISQHNTEEQQIKELTFFVKNIDVKHIDQKIIEKLYYNGINNIIKLLYLQKKDLMNIDGLKQKMIEKIYNEIDNSKKNLTMLKFMRGSNCFGHGIGIKKLDKLLQKIPDILQLYNNKNDNILVELVININGFDQITTQYVLNGLEQFIKLFKQLDKQLQQQLKNSIINQEQKQLGNKFLNKKFVFTGFRNKDWEQFIQQQGGIIQNSVNKQTDYLIAKQEDIDQQKNLKIQQAIQLNIQIINQEQFQQQFI